VMHALETVLAKRRGAVPAGQAPNGPAIRGLLEKADDTLREAQERSREWTRQTPALLDLVLEEGARTVVARRDPRAEDDPPLLDAARAVLQERDRLAQEVVEELKRALLANLASLRQLAPFARIDPSAVGDLEARGLPLIDLSPLRGALVVGRPRWASLWPWLGRLAARERIERVAGAVLREQVETHERQVRAWMTSQVNQLGEHYQTWTEALRELLRRPSEGTAGEDGAALEADLEQLRRLGSGEVEASPPPW